MYVQRMTGLLVSAAVIGSSAVAVGKAADPGGEARVRVMNTVPRFRLKDQSGEFFGSTQHLEGKVWIADFIFTRCTSTCPSQTSAFGRLQAELAADPATAEVQLVSITVDPANDTPEVLAEYAHNAGADPAHWTFLTGKKPQIESLVKQGFRLPINEPDGAAPLTHSQSFVLVDRARRVRGHYDGLDDDALEQLEADLRVVLTDPPGPATIERDKGYFDDPSPGPVVHVPLSGADTPWLDERAAAQEATRDRFKVFNDFSFADRQPESGMDFISHVVDDATHDYKAVHYDHGNGVVVADIDGDGLYDVYLVSQMGANGLFKNLGGGKFQNVTESAGVGLADRVSVTASFADIDNDGDEDLYVTTVRFGNAMFENDGKGHFKDISKESGLDHVGHCSSAVFFDYDRDGLLDVFLTVVGVYTTDETGRGGYYIGYPDAFNGQTMPKRFRRSILFHNDGKNKFSDASKATGLLEKAWCGAASPIDLNQDGFQDLYVLNMQGHDEYWENVGGKSFVNKGREVFPKTPWGSMGVKVFDFDNDGLMDIYVTDMHTDMVDDALGSRRAWYAEKMKMTDTYPIQVLNTDGRHILGNAFYHNRGEGRFREISDDIGAENYWPWGLSVADLNADGWDDAFITSSMNYPFRYGVNSLLLNNQGQEFLDSEFLLGVEPRRDRRTSAYWFTLDCDGADKDHPICADRKGRIDVWATIGSRSSVVFDLDLDGDLDIVTNDFNSEPMVLISDLSARKKDLSYLMVDLIGEKSNRDGLGARVVVKVGDRTLTKVHDGQSGYMSQSAYPLYFGLDGAKAADEVTVTWPAGGVQVLKGPIAANQVLTVGEE